MIKIIINTNRLTQRKTSSFTLTAIVFVVMLLIVLRAPLVLLDSAAFELLLILDQSFSGMNSILISWTPSKIKNISSPGDAQVLWEKNLKIPFYK